MLGSPIGHSLSPVLHRAAYQALGLDDWSYTAIETDEAGLPGLLARVRSQPGWAGLSLTMPLKTAAVPLVDRLDASVEAVGALNTIVVEPGASLTGCNTDIAGIRYAVRQVLGVAAVPPVRPLLLGAGGTARAAVAALAAVGVRRVGVVARRAAAVVPLTAIGARLGIEAVALPWETVAGGLPRGVDLVVATTPAGVTDQLAEWAWPAGCPLVELLYHPWPTALAVTAYRAGARVGGGMVVLAAQAAEQVALFTGRPVRVDVLLAAGTRALTRRAALDALSPAKS
ncbi:shikimate dehydrogenase [Pseudofrankia sp. DC12]|uniref:shikimate dehydrogenase family protein n=1 Tax=Pseudofrankia sp. DC12 TaxID=683315 RepID=UPI0005F85EFF|nr:shikimate dehydrogenase [Pseudofrankia sp. DC12]